MMFVVAVGIGEKEDENDKVQRWQDHPQPTPFTKYRQAFIKRRQRAESQTAEMKHQKHHNIRYMCACKRLAHGTAENTKFTLRSLDP